MDLNVSNKVVLITGASRGIGAATARLFAAEGADVIVGYHRNQAGAEETALAVEAVGRRAWTLQLDVSSNDSVAAAFESLRKDIDGIDGLIVCAGHNIVTPLDELEPAEWDTIVDINLNGAFYVLHAALPLLRDGASIVTVSSVAAYTGAPHHAHYAAAKAGLINLTKSAARALAPRIRVNCVAPGITLTEMGQDTVDTLAPDYAERKLLTQRFATPEEVARCIVFLTSPTIGFVTGATLDANGGRYLR